MIQRVFNFPLNPQEGLKIGLIIFAMIEKSVTRLDFLKLTGLMLLYGCAPGPVNTLITATASETPIAWPTSTATAMEIADTQTPTATEAAPKELILDVPVYTPPSLMLHSAALPQMKDLLPLLAQSGYRTVTYKTYYEALLNNTPLNNPLLLSIDDLPVTHLNPGFMDMISEIHDYGMSGTLGIVTRGTREEANPKIWEYLKALKEFGWELANHTQDHALLPSYNDSSLNYEIQEASRRIYEATGEAPVTLIVPYGNINNATTNKPDQRIFDVSAQLGIKWVVGIPDGKHFSGKPPYYVGRVPTGETAQITLQYLVNSFGPK